jgi:hypothetical protein
MLKILERLSAGRPSVDAAVLDKVLRLADGLELWSARSYELTLTILLRAKHLKAAESLCERMRSVNAPVSALADVEMARLKASATSANALTQRYNEQEIPHNAKCLAEFILQTIKDEKMDIAGEAWSQMNLLHGRICGQVVWFRCLVQSQ